MGYIFKQEQSIAVNINRIIAEEVKAALNALENPSQVTGETIHGVRKRIKKIRALFRLVRSELNEKDFQRENRYFRSIGHQLSQLRDATVMINTVDKLRETYSDKITLRLFATIRKALVHKQDQVTRAFFDDQNNQQEVIDGFRKAPMKVTGLARKHHAFSVFGPNLREIYRRGRKALRVATQEPTIHHFHELRKEVKTLWYHTRLLQPMWPGHFKAYGQELGRLGELLGDDHDFGVLAEEIESGRLLLRNKQAKATVLHLLHEQRTQLQAQIYPLANRLFAQKIGDFVDNYRLYWKLWQAEGHPKTRSTNRREA